MSDAVRAAGYLVAGLGLLATFAAYHGEGTFMEGMIRPATGTAACGLVVAMVAGWWGDR